MSSNVTARADQIAFADIPQPTPGPDEILVQVHAVGLNPIGYMIPKGTFKPILRFHPGHAGKRLAGLVVEVGSRVTRFKRGDAVFASIFAGVGHSRQAQAALLLPPQSSVQAHLRASQPTQVDYSR